MIKKFLSVTFIVLLVAWQFVSSQFAPLLLADEMAAIGTVVKAPDESWPPLLPGAVNGTVTVSTDDFLIVPATVKEGLAKPGAMQFVMAKKAPTVELAYHRDLPDRALNGTGWSAWGDICVASDGKVYSGRSWMPTKRPAFSPATRLGRKFTPAF
jgi:hypothetical protein